jgi:nucleoside-diphosphate-sugar epimerase
MSSELRRPRRQTRVPAPAALHALLTGYPGFIAKRLVRRLLDEGSDAEVVCLVEERRRADAEADIALLPPEQRVRMKLLVGDVSKMDLGLAGLEIAALSDVTHIFHLAALQTTSASPAALEAINVVGVRNMLALAKELPGLRRFVHFSSCFVCGDRVGVVLEDDLLDEPLVHRSTYEDSKYRGERLARAAMSDLPISIVRPSVVVGDSATGEVDRFDGVYAMGILTVTSPIGVPIPLPGPGIAPLHLVPVDYLTRVVVEIARNDSAVGKTFHVVDPNPLSARMIYDLVAQRAGKKTAPTVASAGLALLARRAAQVAKQVSGTVFDVVPGLERMRKGAAAADLFDRFVVFNASNTAALLAGTDVVCPRFDSYVDTLVKFVKDSLRQERHVRRTVQDPLL